MLIKVIRSKKGITQSELAKEIGVDRSTVAKWESGKAFPRAETLKKLARVLGCKTDELLDDPA